MQPLHFCAFILQLFSILHAAGAIWAVDTFIKDKQDLDHDSKTLADSASASAEGKALAPVATGVKDAAERLRTAATTWYAEQERLVAQMGPGMTGAEVSAHYAVALEDVRADLQKTFAARPLGGLGADGKKEKPEAWKSQLYEDVSMILDRIEDAIVEVQRILDAPEAQTRASFGAVKPFLRTVMVLAGKFAHEHPLFFDKVILPILMTMLMPFVPKIVAFILLNMFLSILEAQRPIPAGA